MRYVVDIDGTICTQEKDYSLAEPFVERIAQINELYDNGNYIIYFTARGSGTGIDWRETTENQFANWGVKYHELIFGKPFADYYIDDRMLDIQWREKEK